MIEINLTTDISDVQRLLRTLRHFENVEIPRISKDSVKRMERSAKKLIRTGSRSGKHYSGQPNRSSSGKKSEAPKTQTGHLASSIGTSYRGSPKLGVSQATVGATALHALFLEFGTRDKGKGSGKNKGIAPRPFFKPTIKKEMPLLINNILEALR